MKTYRSRQSEENEIFADGDYTTGISKNCHRTTSEHVRYQGFRQQEALTTGLRGDANIMYAWYGTSKQGVSSVVLHGFGQPKTPKDGAMYGIGIYLYPEKYSNASAVYSDFDDNGEQHVVLCRIIMGNMEQAPRGSTQFHPVLPLCLRSYFCSKGQQQLQRPGCVLAALSGSKLSLQRLGFLAVTWQCSGSIFW
ncbi:hypothetical protein L7F22_059427 [Adiantum nelumboides]|nr:hypothetical protein [Adiantum nelumboides]